MKGLGYIDAKYCVEVPELNSGDVKEDGSARSMWRVKIRNHLNSDIHTAWLKWEAKNRKDEELDSED